MHDQYQPDFTVVGVDSPEFAFERSIENVERVVREHGLEYPYLMLLAEAVGPAAETRAAS